MTRIAVLHPGAMGVTVAASSVEAGHEVHWVTEGRSGDSAERAERAGLIGQPTLSAACDVVDMVISVCPPDAALAVAHGVAATGFAGVYVDANAIAPATSEMVGGCFGAEVRFVDGSIIGPPARRPGTTRLYLSGDDEVRAVAKELSGGPLEVIAVDGGIGAASALKMAYAGWTKGSSALLLAVAAYADESGVLEGLVAEWDRSLPGLADDLRARAAGVGPKAWRFAGEMDEIASAFESGGLPGGFHLGAAAVYAALADFKDAAELPTLEEVVAALRSSR
ncbi:MAG: DUF1932 domain-containing protein [Actinomycetota bacterium]